MEILIKTGISVVVGMLAGCTAIYVFNKMPPHWLCDYDETPSKEISDPYIQRVKGFPWRWIYAAGFSCLLIKLTLFDIQYAAAALFACWALLIIGLADLKYKIIPDQFVIMLALTGFGFIPYHSSVTQPLIGALTGGCVMLMVSVMGGATLHKEVMGFGDVKLSASLGLLLGIKGIAAVLVATSIHSGIVAAAGMMLKKYKKGDTMALGPYICGWGYIYIFIVWPLLLG